MTDQLHAHWGTRHARLRLLVDRPELSDPEAAGDDGAQFLVEALAVQVFDRAEGLILNAASETDSTRRCAT